MNHPIMQHVDNHFMDIFGGDIVENIRGATNDLRESNDAHHLNEKFSADNFIQEATAGECLHVLNYLIERVAELTGDAETLEDAADELKVFIEENNNKENESEEDDADDGDTVLCASCNGSGEGQYEGTTCWNCKGTGAEVDRG